MCYSFKELTNTLRYRILGEIVLGLPGTWVHTKDVTHKVLLVNGPYPLWELCWLRAVEQEGQELQVTVKLLDPLHKLPNRNTVGFL